MPKLSPISRKKFITKLKQLGFSGPHQEGKHPYLIKGQISLTIPNQHEKEISVDLLNRILRQAGISRAEWLDSK